MDWKAFFNPKLVFRRPIRSVGILCLTVGIFKSPIDFDNRYLAFGFFLTCLSFAVHTTRWVYNYSQISYVGEEARLVFRPALFFQALGLWPLTVVFAFLWLHQLGLTPRLDAYLFTWLRAHSL